MTAVIECGKEEGMSTTVKERLEQYPEISFIEGISFETFLSDLLKTYQERYRELTGKEAELPGSSIRSINIVQLFLCFSIRDCSILTRLEKWGY